MKHYKKCAGYFLLGIIFLELFFLLGLLSANIFGVIHGLDLQVTEAFASMRTPGLTTFMSFITNMGDYEFLLHSAGIAALLVAVFGHLEVAVGTFAGLAFTSFFTGEMKRLFHRLRPEDFFITRAGGWSYPSGHMSGISIVCIMIIWAACCAIPHKLTRRIVITLAVIIATLVGISRIYLGVHWFSDVIGGAFLALGIAFILVGILKGTKQCVVCRT